MHLSANLTGLASGYHGRLDLILMRAADIQLAIPSMVLYIAIMAVLGINLFGD
jgi:ABC-type dipeptide/oligopeptide/nickel transport system permease subunit